MSPGCCQIRICYPKYSPQQDLPLVQKYAEWKKAHPDSSWAVGKHHHGLNGKSGVECSFRKQIFFFFFKKVPKQLKILANQKQCCGTVLITCVSITYSTGHNLIIFCFFSWQQVNSHKERLAHQDQKEPIGIRHLGISLDLHMLTCQSLETETSELPHECWREVIDFIRAQKYIFPEIAFNHANNNTGQRLDMYLEVKVLSRTKYESAPKAAKFHIRTQNEIQNRESQAYWIAILTDGAASALAIAPIPVPWS